MHKQVTPILDHSVRGLCSRPYPGHDTGKNIGCPNFNYKQGCPPFAKLFEQVFDLTQPVYALYNAFDFKSHVEKMRIAHPDWSQRQLECCYYWQNGARKKLTESLIYFMTMHPDYHVAVAFYKGLDKDLRSLYSRVIPSPPEAMGVDITKTMADAGIELEWPPVNVAYQVALAGRLI